TGPRRWRDRRGRRRPRAGPAPPPPPPPPPAGASRRGAPPPGGGGRAVRAPGHPGAGRLPPFPWCPLPERLTLTARPTCARHIERGIPAGVESARKLLAGWDAFDRTAPAAARDLVDALGSDPAPLVAALGRVPAVGLHGDLK